MIRFDDQGLVPVVVQDADTGQVLMLAYANAEAVQLTQDTGWAHFWSRSRQQLWKKGESSGNTLEVVALKRDCDNDALLYQVRPSGPTCHTGETSCFHHSHWSQKDAVVPYPIAGELSQVIKERRQKEPDGSYVASLFAKGEDAILKKVGEEAVEVVLAAKAKDRPALVYETADLIFHLLVALEYTSVSWTEVLEELAGRRR